jgi:hypothetical protein
VKRIPNIPKSIDHGLGIGTWFHNTFSGGGGNNKRDGDDRYDGNFFHPEFKAFAQRKGVSIPDLDNFKEFSANVQHHTVQDDDTGVDMAAKCGIKLHELKEANPLLEWENLQIGKDLNILQAGDLAADDGDDG